MEVMKGPALSFRSFTGGQGPREGAHVVCVLPDTEGEHLQVGLNLLDAGPRLGIGVKRDGDARQHAEDRPHDYELGERDSALGTRCALLRPATSHLHVSSGYPRSRGS